MWPNHLGCDWHIDIWERKENILGTKIVWTFLYLIISRILLRCFEILNDDNHMVINFQFPCSGLLNLGSCILSNHYGVSSLAICTFVPLRNCACFITLIFSVGYRIAILSVSPSHLPGDILHQQMGWNFGIFNTRFHNFGPCSISRETKYGIVQI